MLKGCQALGLQRLGLEDWSCGLQPSPDCLTIGWGIVHVKQGLGFRSLPAQAAFLAEHCSSAAATASSGQLSSGTPTTANLPTATATATTIAAASAKSSSASVVRMVRVLLVLFWALDVLVTVVVVTVLEWRWQLSSLSRESHLLMTNSIFSQRRR